MLGKEQEWYETLRSYDKSVGYNLSEIARSGSRYKTFEDLDAGRLSFTRHQFDIAAKFLCESDIPIPEVASLSGIAERTLYQMYFKTEYSKLVGELPIRKRVNTASRKLNEETVGLLIDELLSGGSITDVAKTFDLAIETVRDIRNKVTWKALTQDIVFPPLPPKRPRPSKAVNQYDKNMNFIASYESARVAEKETGVGYRLISQVCHGQKPSAHGYIFKFAS